MTNPLLSQQDLALVEAVAQRVLELLAEREAPRHRSRFVSAAELAELLGVSRYTIYQHADELGAVRLGDGPRSKHGGARLRFDADQALARWTARQASLRSQPPDPPAPAGRSRPRRRRRTGSGAPLLPVKGREAA